MPDAPKIEIASRVFQAGTVRVKGYLEGTDLKSAGIFDGDTKSRDIDVASVPGEQRLNFDFSIEQPSPAQSIRVTDSYGREAQAMVAPDPAGVGAMRGSEELIEVDPGAAASPGEAGPLAESPLASAGPAVRNNTVEIARPGDALSPSQRHINASSSLGALTNVQINVDRCRSGDVHAGDGGSSRADRGAGRPPRRRLRQWPAGQADSDKRQRYQHLQPDFSDAGGQRGDDSCVRQRQRFRGSVGGRGRLQAPG